MKKADAVAAFTALAQGTRVDILRYLVECGTFGAAAGSIGEHLGVSSQTLTFHLNCLTGAGLITRRREGRFIIYSAKLDVLNALAGYLLENCCARQNLDCLAAARTNAMRRRAFAFNARREP
jgi:DNA-binding transcriptional ArsR family regulator